MKRVLQPYFDINSETPNINMVIGESNSGKTSLLIEIACGYISHNKNVVFVTTEDTLTEIYLLFKKPLGESNVNNLLQTGQLVIMSTSTTPDWDSNEECEGYYIFIDSITAYENLDSLVAMKQISGKSVWFSKQQIKNNSKSEDLRLADSSWHNKRINSILSIENTTSSYNITKVK